MNIKKAAILGAGAVVVLFWNKMWPFKSANKSDGINPKGSILRKDVWVRSTNFENLTAEEYYVFKTTKTDSENMEELWKN